jgi:hypothetical protein
VHDGVIKSSENDPDINMTNDDNITSNESIRAAEESALWLRSESKLQENLIDIPAILDICKNIPSCGLRIDINAIEGVSRGKNTINTKLLINNHTLLMLRHSTVY